MNKYDSIIHMSRPVSAHHLPQPEEKRAAQFSPFAALTGYEDVIEETARLTEPFTELCEEQLRILNQTFQIIEDHTAEHLNVLVTYFERDEKKSGGSYRSSIGNIKKVDTVCREIIFDDGQKIRMDDITGLEVLENGHNANNA